MDAHSRTDFAPGLALGQPVNTNPKKGPVLVGGQWVDLRREASVAAQIRAYLITRGFQLMRPDPGRARLACYNAGIPDIITCTPRGRLVAIEVKRPKARRRDNEVAQNRMLAWLEKRGALVIVARSVLEVAEALNGMDASDARA